VLSGCSAAEGSAGAAAVVGDKQVSNSSVADAVSQVQAQLPTVQYDAQKVTSDTVTRLTLALVVDAAGVAQGVVVTDSQVDSLIATTAKTQGGMNVVTQTLLTQDSVPESAIPDYARTFLIEQGIAAKMATGTSDGGQQAMLKYLGTVSTQLGTSISPRYGTWNPTTLSLGPVPNDLSSPAASASPSPSS
jgi:hypothetical protein